MQWLRARDWWTEKGIAAPHQVTSSWRIIDAVCSCREPVSFVVTWNNELLVPTLKGSSGVDRR